MPASDLIGPKPGQPSTASHAFLEGWRRVFAAPALVAGIWGLTLAAVTIVDSAPGGAPWLAAAAGTVVRILLLGGALDRLARARPVGIRGFIGACGRYWWRFVRLGLLTWPVAALLVVVFRPADVTSLPGWWWDPTLPGAASAAGHALPTTVLSFVALGLLGAVVDIARVRLVVEDRRSALAAIPAAIRFMRNRAGRTAALVALNALVVAAVIGLWRLATGATPTTDWALSAGVPAGLLLGLGIRLGILGSMAAFFQAELAHPPVSAGPEPLWPDAPAAGDLH